MPNIHHLISKFSQDIWQGECNNTPSIELEETWNILFKAFDSCQKNNDNKAPAKRIVVPAPTGTGKTLSMGYYASQLDESVGMLIVTSFISEANEIENFINKFSDKNKAAAYHSESSLKYEIDKLKEYQIAVITHNQFIGATDRKQNEVGLDRSRIDKLYNFEGGKRQIVVIDESIETIQETNLEYGDVHLLMTLLNGYITHKDSNKEYKDVINEEINSLNELADLFDKFKSKLGGASETPIDIKEFNDELKGCNLSFPILKELNNNGELKKHNKAASNESKKGVKEILNNITTLVKSDWLYYTNKQRFHTARDAQPEDTTIVVLDATSSINYYYKIHSNIQMINSIPGNVRSYSNVNLFITDKQKTGKQELTNKDNIAEYVNSIATTVDSAFSSEKTAVFTFKNIEERLYKFFENKGIKGIESGHFGDLNGKNDYRDCTTLYIIGTPFKPKYVITNIHALSTRGYVDCFSNDENVKQERVRLEYTLIAADIIQAINRVSCRKVVNKNGDCPNTKVYLTMPDNEELASTIIYSIKKQMPDIKLGKWDFSLVKSKKRGPKPQYEDKLIQAINALDKDTSFPSIVKDLELSKKQQENLRNRLNKNNSDDLLNQTLKSNGVIFKKLNNLYYFIKL